MGKKIDSDVKAIRDAARALMGSTSQRMLRANMAYLWDLFIEHPPSDMPPRLSAQHGVQSDVPSWDCQHCDNRKIGAAFAECPNCGTARG